MDTVVPGLNGLFFTEQSVEALAAALEDSRLDGPWDGEAMVAHAHCFRRERFRRAVSERLAEAWRRHREGEEHV